MKIDEKQLMMDRMGADKKNITEEIETYNKKKKHVDELLDLNKRRLKNAEAVHEVIIADIEVLEDKRTRAFENNPKYWELMVEKQGLSFEAERKSIEQEIERLETESKKIELELTRLNKRAEEEKNE